MLEKHKLLNTFSQNLAIMGTTFYFRIAYKCEISIVFWFFKADYIVGSNYVGGLIGYSSGSVSNSYATGAVTGGGAIGGLSGFSGGTVSNSYATGTVTGNAFVGGLIGGSGGSGGSVSNSYATGAVTGSGQRVGGLIGEAGSYPVASVVSNSYATGAVTGRGSRVGGLIGHSSGSGSSVIGKNYFVDASGGSNGLGSGTCTGTCTHQTAVQIAAPSPPLRAGRLEPRETGTLVQRLSCPPCSIAEVAVRPFLVPMTSTAMMAMLIYPIAGTYSQAKPPFDLVCPLCV